MIPSECLQEYPAGIGTRTLILSEKLTGRPRGSANPQSILLNNSESPPCIH